MRRVVFLVMGLLELGVAAVLVAFAWQLPAHSEVDQTFDRAERVTGRTGSQVKLFREQVHDLRRPELQDLGHQLQDQTKTVTGTLKSQAVDFDRLQTVGDALGDVANGLDGLGETLDGDNLGKMGEGLGATASYLDQQVAPTAGRAADRLDQSTADLCEDARKLSALLRQAPPDLKATKEIHDGLGRFGEGLDRMQDLLKAERLTSMRDGVQGAGDFAGHRRRAGRTAVGLPLSGGDHARPEAGGGAAEVLARGREDRRRDAQGGRRRQGRRRGDGGTGGRPAQAARGPRRQPQDGRPDPRRLALALKQQDKLEVLLKNVPEHSPGLADELPKLTGDLSATCARRSAQGGGGHARARRKGVDAAVAKWPQLKTDLSHAAVLLRSTRGQVRQALERREEYEAALKQSIVLAETFATLLPIYLESLDRQLEQQEEGLGDLSHGLDEVTAAIPEYGKATNRLLDTARLLVWLVAGIVLLHGAYLVASVRLGKGYAV